MYLNSGNSSIFTCLIMTNRLNGDLLKSARNRV